MNFSREMGDSGGMCNKAYKKNVFALLGKQGYEGIKVEREKRL